MCFRKEIPAWKISESFYVNNKDFNLTQNNATEHYTHIRKIYNTYARTYVPGTLGEGDTMCVGFMRPDDVGQLIVLQEIIYRLRTKTKIKWSK